MYYEGSAAYQLDTRQATALPRRRQLSVYDGGRDRFRNQRTRTAAAPQSLIAAVAVLVITFAVLGAIRVAITTATVTCLRQLETAETHVAAEYDTRTELQVERSALASADRIQRIATDNYGMVYATEVDSVVLPQEVEEAEPESAEAVFAFDLADFLPFLA